MISTCLAPWAIALALAAGPKVEPKPAPDKDVVLQALTGELARSFKQLKGNGDASVYYLSYRLNDGTWFQDSASFGALEKSVDDDPLAGRLRFLDVSVRVGSRRLDNTHQLRDQYSWSDWDISALLPVEDDLGALKVGIWRATDKAFNRAVNRYLQVKANRAVKVEEEDQADDFSQEKAQVSLGDAAQRKVDRKAWQGRLRALSARFKSHPNVLRSSVALQAGTSNAYFVDSDGARIREGRFYARVIITGAVKADDGMDLDLFDSFEATAPEQLPADEQIAAKIDALIAKLEALRKAPMADPYTGPAIIVNRAAAVFFHEIFGHRVEGHRQKDADEGKTFTKKVGQKVVPELISVSDDPTRARFGDTPLNGAYQFDDEGVAAQKVVLVKDGVLKGFLMSRSPVEGFPRSNGHGRAQPGTAPVARQGNLIVESSKAVPFAELRKQLVAEAKRRGKPYGLVFEDIAGGFTFTRAGFLPQAFKVLPLVVTRVWADGRPDELVRGLDIVGTPLASFENILATGDDDAVFNGFCGAESGFVPVSAVAPSLLVREIEVERKAKSQQRPPLLAPPPLAPPPVAIQEAP